MEKQLQQIGLKMLNHHEVTVEEGVEVEIQTHKILRLRLRMTVMCHLERMRKIQEVLHLWILRINPQNDNIVTNSNKLMNLHIKMESQLWTQFKEQIWNEVLLE